MSDSNIDSFCSGLDRLRSPLDFQHDNLGSRLLDGQAKRIMDRAASESGTEGPWEANRGRYGEEKRKKGIPVGVGLRPSSSPMLAPDNVRGERSISADEASMTAGVTDQARKVAGYFSAERPFYGATDGDREAIRDEVARAVRHNLGIS